MAPSYHTIAIASTLLIAAGSSQALTIMQTSTFNGHTYILIGNDSSTRMTWNEAQAAALTLGGNLVTVNDTAENQYLLTTFAPTAVAVAPQGGGLISLWLGLNDAATESNFVWVDGAPVTYTNWVPGEPAGGAPDEDYAGMLVGPGFGAPGQWHDIVSDFRFNDVVFGVVEVVPEPETYALMLCGIGFLSTIARRRRKAN